jgi:mono/diheme cytochrome c family protein
MIVRNDLLAVSRIAAVATGLVLAAVAATPSRSHAQQPAAAAAPDSTSQAAIDAGREVFHGAGNCFVCHGANLEGGPMAPTLQAHAWKDAKGGSYSAILNVIVNGVSGTAMVSHPSGISHPDAQRVAAYVYAVSHGKAKA